ncbi:glyoxalase-like domain protein [Burkholderia ambifaria AMMD]|jgi:catechol-2,3-dioxygenase|uniref:Glyoxalase/bleomycin resistance protein/dioxygenase n=1 Tax=Burkholderia ambifaria (strain ATCC BAA-244 / DSM 16087 / CCUG 44356 / LMG 19182 / AMMD) TaxID=339670 RepID=Q0B7L4_BURCM|nr:VOC family protein [Burkholderia ambifaria]ABI89859.1 Glyoxalase/bleomycin resistance protein/dioxygenase [Burkholderia ambifaria AMMD]AJY23621.1 glyoxalase-like domain protein [Burkholderia ambifaria AMMD]MBR7930401.1 VOC family protein [Burkholderia ambifaria]PEH67956.1 glyoxalase [Burkholderia ambifaria]QQC07493.1 VOC family protein [Burkholderia ambifaria]
MKQPLVTALRGIAIGVPDLALAEQFYTETWRLAVVARTADAVYLRGTGAAHHILALHRSEQPDVRSVDFSVASIDALHALAQVIPEHGGAIVSSPDATGEPGGGTQLVARDPQGRILRFIAGDERHVDTAEVEDRPVKITHVVLNSADVAVAQRFFEDALGFKLSDRTRIMAFMRCSSDHHSIALADATENTLNHIAFLMPDLDSVMRGGGRMNDAGYPIEWGVGRHGPGNNVFAYFLGPFDFVIEYTAEVQQVDDTYRTGGPADWTWPPGRIDQWGVGRAPSPRLKEAQKRIFFHGEAGRHYSSDPGSLN